MPRIGGGGGGKGLAMVKNQYVQLTSPDSHQLCVTTRTHHTHDILSLDHLFQLAILHHNARAWPPLLSCTSPSLAHPHRLLAPVLRVFRD